jgi:hypothetical protein
MASVDFPPSEVFVDSSNIPWLVRHPKLKALTPEQQQAYAEEKQRKAELREARRLWEADLQAYGVENSSVGVLLDRGTEVSVFSAERKSLGLSVVALPSRGAGHVSGTW